MSLHDRIKQQLAAGRGPGPEAIPIDPRELARMERTSAAEHGKMAEILWAGGDAFGVILGAIEEMGRDGWRAIADEEVAADRLVIDGPQLIRDLRSIAMRLDRAVMVRMAKDD